MIGRALYSLLRLKTLSRQQLPLLDCSPRPPGAGMQPVGPEWSSPQLSVPETSTHSKGAVRSTLSTPCTAARLRSPGRPP